MIGTFDAILDENPPWRYLAGLADPPPVKAKRGRMPQMRLYTRADHQTLILPAVTDGETADDDQPPLYQVGGKLREWCDVNCLNESRLGLPGATPAEVKHELAAYRRMP